MFIHWRGIYFHYYKNSNHRTSRGQSAVPHTGAELQQPGVGRGIRGQRNGRRSLVVATSLAPQMNLLWKKKEIKVAWKEVRGQENSRGQKGYANTSAAFHDGEGTEIKGRWWMHGFCMASQLQGHRAHCLECQNSISWYQNNYGEGEDWHQSYWEGSSRRSSTKQKSFCCFITI